MNIRFQKVRMKSAFVIFCIACHVFLRREIQHANVHHERNCCRRFDWFDGGNGNDDDAAGKKNETCTCKKRVANDASACPVLDSIMQKEEKAQTLSLSFM